MMVNSSRMFETGTILHSGAMMSVCLCVCTASGVWCSGGVVGVLSS